MRRVVITGIGCKTPIGNTLNAVQKSLREGIFGNKENKFLGVLNKV